MDTTQAREWMTTARKLQGLTCAAIGAAVGVTAQAINAIEKGVRNPSVTTAKRIANTLGVDWTRFYE